MNGQGTTFSRSADGTTWVAYADVADISAPEITRSSSENGYISDTAGYKEFEPGMKDPGEMEVTLKWLPGDANQALLRNDLDTNDNLHYRIDYPDGSKHTFMGHITSWGINLSKEETIMRKVKFKVSGPITETVGP